MLKSRVSTKWFGLVLAAALTTPLIGCGDDEVSQPAATDLITVAQGAGSFNTLLAAVEAAGLTSVLQGDGPYTVFAPTDAAFNALPAGVLDGLLADPNALADVLLYHVASGELLASDLEGDSYVTTAQGQDIAITLGSIKLNGVPVSQADIMASNGVIHVIDQVLLPPSGDLVQVAADAGTFTTLVAAVQAAGLESALQGDGPFTVFAPTDAAFAALPPGTVEGLLADPAALAEVLKYHVLDAKVYTGDLDGTVSAQTLAGYPVLFSSAGAQVNNSLVGPSNVLATNGVIHVIDTVLLPPTKDLVETAVDAGFSTLVTAVQAAGLVDALQGPGPLTVFAPTNEAFANLAPGVLESLLADPQALANVLLYHVASGQFFAGDLLGVPSITMLQGQSASINLTGGVFIDDASVTSTDIIATNGVIHVINQVLLPN
jgi:uncharacterized surface protein with fasciclin (FAS1) repeats